MFGKIIKPQITTTKKPPSIQNFPSEKLMIYKQIICPSMKYGIQIWDTAKISNQQILRSFQ